MSGYRKSASGLTLMEKAIREVLANVKEEGKGGKNFEGRKFQIGEGGNDNKQFKKPGLREQRVLFLKKQLQKKKFGEKNYQLCRRRRVSNSQGGGSGSSFKQRGD